MNFHFNILLILKFKREPNKIHEVMNSKNTENYQLTVSTKRNPPISIHGLASFYTIKPK